MSRIHAIVGILVLAAASLPLRAERAPEEKEKADYILTGEVAKVFTRRSGRLTEYVVQLIVGEVHKGEGVKKGDAFYVYVFQKSPSLLPVAEPRGHNDVPKEGAVIKAYVHDRAGRHEGNYKDWFEVVTVEKSK